VRVIRSKPRGSAAARVIRSNRGSAGARIIRRRPRGSADTRVIWSRYLPSSLSVAQRVDLAVPPLPFLFPPANRLSLAPPPCRISKSRTGCLPPPSPHNIPSIAHAPRRRRWLAHKSLWIRRTSMQAICIYIFNPPTPPPHRGPNRLPRIGSLPTHHHICSPCPTSLLAESTQVMVGSTSM
jgi:hypothetical protein